MSREVGKENKKEDKKEELLKHKTMSLSIKEGCMASVASGTGESYVLPFALALNFNNFQVGLLKSFVGLLPPVFQYYGSRLMEKWARKRIIVRFVFWQALMWFVLLGIGFLYWKNLWQTALPYILIFSYTLLSIFGALATPAWFSLLGDIVPSDYRGRYFSKRNRICESIALVAFLIAAFILDYFKTKGLILVGFMILFALAGFFRMISAAYFTKHYEPKFRLDEKHFFGFKKFLNSILKTNFGRFAIFSALFHLSVAIAGPFFTVYMLKELGFSYITFMSVSLAGSVFSLLSLMFLGKFSDRYGNKKLMVIGSFFISITPFFWLFSKSPVYLALLPQFFSGIGWAAFSLASTNFIYDVEKPVERAPSLAYYNIFLGFGAFIGSLLGGYAAQYVPKFFSSALFLVFITSGLLRAIVSLVFLPRIVEPRQVKSQKVPALNLLAYKVFPGFWHRLILIKKLEKKIENNLKNKIDGIRKTAPLLIFEK